MEKANCPYCGKPFQSNTLYCSKECYLRSRFGDDRISTTICLQCGNQFSARKSNRQKFCSRSCANQFKTGKPNLKLRNRVNRICAWCGATITRSPSQFHGMNTFCNYQCEANWSSEFLSKESSSRWKGGQPTNPEWYGIDWHKARKNALIKANHICEKCHRKAPLEIHHKLPVRFFDKPNDAHFFSNLIALCKRCHLKEHQKLIQALPLLDILQFQRSTSSLDALNR